jgi:hypothetical protein
MKFISFPCYIKIIKINNKAVCLFGKIVMTKSNYLQKFRFNYIE